MESKDSIEIALRAAMIAKSVLGLMEANDVLVAKLITIEAMRKLDELRRFIKSKEGMQV